jgi:hypothetical protein
MACFLAALVISTLCSAQQPLRAIDLRSPENTGITFSVSEEGIPLDALLNVASGYGIRFNLADVELSGKQVFLHGAVSVSKTEFARLIECLCYREGILWKRGNTEGEPFELVRDERPEWRVHPDKHATLLWRTLVSGFDLQPDDPVFTPIELANMSADQACIRLRPFLSTKLELGQLGDGKAVVVQGRRADVELAYALFRAIDVPEGARPVVVSSVEVKRIEPDAVAEPMTYLLRAAAQASDSRMPCEAAVVGVHFSRRALILCGTEGQVALAKQILTLLDQAPK